MTTSTTPTDDPVLQRYTSPAKLTAVVPAPSAVADAAEQLDLQLKQTRDQALDLVGEETTDALVSAIRAHDATAGRSLVAVLAPDETVTVWDTDAELPAAVVPGPLPALTHLMVQRQAWVPHIVVQLDRVGADLTVASNRHDREETSVDGSELHITKSNPGGWSQRRFQQRAEDQRDDNAGDVADRLVDLVRDHDLELVLIAGHEEMIGRLRDDLPPSVDDLVTVLDRGSRADDGSADAMEAAVDQAVRSFASERREGVRQSVLDALGRGDGVTGRADVLDALYQGRVDTLLVLPEATAGLHAHIGPEPQEVAADASVLHELGRTAERVPLVDAALRGAAATGASVVFRTIQRDGYDLDAADARTDEDSPVVDGLAASLRG